VEVAPEGRLALALTLIRATRDEWRGYAVTATRDALVRLLRSPESGAAELYATDGSAEWAFAWRGALAARALSREELRPPLAIDPALFQELDRLARDFVAGWIWFAAGEQEEIAVERSRYASYGYAVAAANVRTSRLHRMRADAGEGARLVHSTLGQDDLWAKDLILATWARLDTA
jgi:hypothetical protein